MSRSRDRFDSKDAAREAVWNALSESRAARFPFPPHGRIPNFAGAREAAERLLEHPLFETARRIKVNPDAPQRFVRLRALERGIEVYMPTPRLRAGFRRLDPRRIPAEHYPHAVSLSKGEHWSEAVPLDRMPQLDAMVTGAPGAAARVTATRTWSTPSCWSWVTIPYPLPPPCTRCRSSEIFRATPMTCRCRLSSRRRKSSK